MANGSNITSSGFEMRDITITSSNVFFLGSGFDFFVGRLDLGRFGIIDPWISNINIYLQHQYSGCSTRSKAKRMRSYKSKRDDWL